MLSYELSFNEFSKAVFAIVKINTTSTSEFTQQLGIPIESSDSPKIEDIRLMPRKYEAPPPSLPHPSMPPPSPSLPPFYCKPDVALAVCAGPTETCYLDYSCLLDDGGLSNSLGCNAGGFPACRFVGFSFC